MGCHDHQQCGPKCPLFGSSYNALAFKSPIHHPNLDAAVDVVAHHRRQEHGGGLDGQPHKAATGNKIQYRHGWLRYLRVQLVGRSSSIGPRIGLQTESRRFNQAGRQNRLCSKHRLPVSSSLGPLLLARQLQVQLTELSTIHSVGQSAVPAWAYLSLGTQALLGTV